MKNRNLMAITPGRTTLPLIQKYLPAQKPGAGNCQHHREVTASPSFAVVIFTPASPVAHHMGLDRMGEEKGEETLRPAGAGGGGMASLASEAHCKPGCRWERGVRA